MYVFMEKYKTKIIPEFSSNIRKKYPRIIVKYSLSTTKWLQWVTLRNKFFLFRVDSFLAYSYFPWKYISTLINHNSSRQYSGIIAVFFFYSFVIEKKSKDGVSTILHALLELEWNPTHLCLKHSKHVFQNHI